MYVHVSVQSEHVHVNVQNTLHVPPIGAAKLLDTPTAQAAASNSLVCTSFYNKEMRLCVCVCNLQQTHD